MSEAPTRSPEEEAAFQAKMAHRPQQYLDLVERAKGADLSDIAALNAFYIGGVDRHGRRVVVCISQNVPTKEVTLDQLLLYVTHIMEPVVTGPYSIVYIHHSQRKGYNLPFRWLYSVYRILPYAYKKNLKQLILVHPSMSLRALLVLFRPAISSKFWRKLVKLRTLTQLDLCVASTEACLPAVMYRDEHKSKHEMAQPNQPVYATSLPTLLQYESTNYGEPPSNTPLTQFFAKDPISHGLIFTSLYHSEQEDLDYSERPMGPRALAEIAMGEQEEHVERELTELRSVCGGGGGGGGCGGGGDSMTMTGRGVSVSVSGNVGSVAGVSAMQSRTPCAPPSRTDDSPAVHETPPKPPPPPFPYWLGVLQRPTPAVFRNLLACLVRCGTRSEGLFRVAPTNIALNRTCRALNYDHYLPIACCSNDALSAPLPSGAMKRFLRDMPEHLLPSEFSSACVQVMELTTDAERIAQFGELYAGLPEQNKPMLQLLFYFFHHISTGDRVMHTRMTAKNISIVMGPNLFTNASVNATTTLASLLALHARSDAKRPADGLEFFIQHVPEIFESAGVTLPEPFETIEDVLTAHALLYESEVAYIRYQCFLAAQKRNNETTYDPISPTPLPPPTPTSASSASSHASSTWSASAGSAPMPMPVPPPSVEHDKPLSHQCERSESEGGSLS